METDLFEYRPLRHWRLRLTSYNPLRHNCFCILNDDLHASSYHISHVDIFHDIKVKLELGFSHLRRCFDVAKGGSSATCASERR